MDGISNDSDCDGIITEEDCNNNVLSGDADCDGIITEEDCDDENPDVLDPQMMQIVMV